MFIPFKWVIKSNTWQKKYSQPVKIISCHGYSYHLANGLRRHHRQLVTVQTPNTNKDANDERSNCHNENNIHSHGLESNVLPCFDSWDSELFCDNIMPIQIADNSALQQQRYPVRSKKPPDRYY